jgi:methyl-accepting chemotaxis protein
MIQRKLILIFTLFISINLFANDINSSQPAITISQKTVDDTLAEYNKTLVLLKQTQESLDRYHETIHTSVESIKATYKEVSPKIDANSERIVASLEDMNSTVNSSMKNIEDIIDDYYIIEIAAFITLLISINQFLEIALKLRRFRFVRNWIKRKLS